VVLHNVSGPAELAEGREAELLRATASLDLPETLENELEIWRFDSVRVVLIDAATAGKTEIDAPGRYFGEHRLDEVGLGFDAFF
jgi:hypothetical protein